MGPRRSSRRVRFEESLGVALTRWPLTVTYLIMTLSLVVAVSVMEARIDQLCEAWGAVEFEIPRDTTISEVQLRMALNELQCPRR